MRVGILGETYDVEAKARDEHFEISDTTMGICEPITKKIAVDSYWTKEFENKEDREKWYLPVLRHEFIHALFYESGLRTYGEDEILVDWLACQFSKIEAYLCDEFMKDVLERILKEHGDI